MSINNSSLGFSLLEILIAVAIFATSSVILLSGQGSSFLSSERAELLSTATFLARQKMVEVEIELQKDIEKNNFPSDDKEESGSFDEPFESFRWKYTIMKVEIPMVSEEGDDTNVMVANYMKNILDQISKKVREVKLTIFWGDPDEPEEEQPQFSVTTHIVKLK